MPEYYEKQKFVDGETVLSASHLEHIENGIAAMYDKIPAAVPNPSAMTINGSSYDGSKEVDYTQTINGMIDAKAPTIPTKLPNPNTVSVNGVSYDGSKAVDYTDTINSMITAKAPTIPSSLPNPNAVTINGSSYDGSKAVDYTSTINSMITAKAPTIPTKLPNPNAVNVNGVTYDGSSAVNYTSTINSMINAKIPTELPNPNTATINGTTYDGSSAVNFTSTINSMIDSKLPTIPTKLPNPNAASINGTSYNGSAAVDFTNAINSMIDVKQGSVKVYGAKGDGSTDDTAKFQNALAAERVVYVPSGTYVLSGELLIRGNCELVLSQDTVLVFGQTSGNCISMEMSASIRGHHATITVPYAFSGNVINVTTALNQDVTAIEPWYRWDPQWKAGRYITDLNITKHDSKGFCYANQPTDCKGTAIYISADRSGSAAHRSTFIWGLDFSGIRIAGAFSYGIRAVNYNEAWNHEMRISAFICNTEIGVSLEDCHNAYISVAIQPRYAENTSGINTGVYAKHGIQLIRSTNADLSGSRVWDWNANGTKWQNGNQWQHIGMYGDCHGAIVNAFQYYDEPSIDIRNLFYTDTPGNLEKITILQEPFTRWFKPKSNKPYFFDGDTDKELTYKEDFDACFIVGKTPTFTDALAIAINTDGSIYNGIGYSRNGGTISGSGTVNTAQAGTYGHTGFISVHDGSIVRVDGMKLSINGDVRIAAYDANFNLIENRIATASVITSGSYFFPDYAETETGFSFRVAAYVPCAYIRIGLLSKDIASNPTIAVDEELGFTMNGYLADSVKVKAESVTGLEALVNRLIESRLG